MRTLTASALTFSLLSLTILPATNIVAAKRGIISDAQEQAPVPFAETIDGSRNPSSIKDQVAYDLFFRSLIFNAEEQSLANSRLRALAEELQLSQTEAASIHNVAEEFERRVHALDDQVAQIKARHLPNLGAQDISQLNDLQA